MRGIRTYIVQLMGECINHLGTKAVQKTGMQEANYEWILLAIDTVSNLVF